jgi:pimeloyl-ACP methyl ester carboxylesterase
MRPLAVFGAILVLTLHGQARAAEPSTDFGIAAFMAKKADWPAFHGGARTPVNGVSLYYETYGAGPPVLVLHGGLAFLETMHNQIEALAPDHTVIAPDSRGHGRSTDPGGGLHYQAMAEDVVALMDHLHIAKADIVGWSDGGIVGLELAVHHPGRVGRLVVIGANFDPAGLSNDEPEPAADSPRFAPLKAFYQSLSPTPDRWPQFFDKVTRMWRSEPHFTPQQLSTIASPVLVMAGARDSIRREHTDALARAIPGAKELIIPDATHLAPLTHAKAVDAAVVDFLDAPRAP